MEVRITKEMHAGLPVLSKIPFKIEDEEIRFRWDKYYWLDLGKYKSDDLKKLAAACENVDGKIRGAKTLGRDIGTWLAACESRASAGGTRARSVRQAFRLMIEYLRGFPRRHLYQREQEDVEGVSVAYYVSRIAFHEKSHDRCPEHFIFLMYYEEFGTTHETSETFYPKDCLGMTPAEILQTAGYYTETRALHDTYEDDLKKYLATKDEIGTQYLAVGIADDQGIDGNDSNRNEDRWWNSSRATKLLLDKTGEPARVVIDVFRENEKEKDRDRDKTPDQYFWSHQSRANDDDEIELEAGEVKTDPIEIPIHPYVAAFDLARHKRLRIHCANLTKYVYDKKIREKLILPERNARLIDTLLFEKETKFRDVIKGKSGGTIILCQGKPGTGKTMTAEVYAEFLGRALYTVQCSQLGTDPEELESNLMKVLARGRRWGAVMLLDEADVYVHERGSDLIQNAIVGVFLRVLEYHSGVLFLTTNRADLVDDAILSRCTARIPYDAPAPEFQELIWEVLANENGVDFRPRVIKEIVKAHPKCSGRDIKNLLKLAMMVSRDRKCAIDAALIGEVKIFKPTVGDE